ncbi:hypothetical protein H0H93_011419 [Arthromyces matolae]|nr:hypothetical protein H0H93_011419 [Arthromyces matolae]
MPLRVVDGFADPQAVKDASEDYLIFYSSIDCRKVEGLISQTFSGANAPSALIVYVGDRPQWKANDNPFRRTWKLTGVPTIIRLKDGAEIARLVEDEIQASGLSQLLAKA